MTTTFPPRQDDAEPVRVSPVSEDTVHVSAWVDFAERDGLMHALEEAKQESQGKQEQCDDDPADYADGMASSGISLGCIILGGMEWFVSPQGAGGSKGRPYYAYRLTAGGVKILIRRTEGGKRIPNVRIEMGSIPLAQCGGLAGLWPRVLDILADAGGTVTKHVLSRVDAFTDVAGVPVADFTQRFRDGWRVCRARKWAVHGVDPQDNGRTEYGDGRQDSGFSIGTNKKLRVYDKIREMAKDPLKQEVFAQRYGGRLPDVLTRVEFQLRREALAELEIAGRFRLDTVEDWLKYREAVWDELAARDGDGWFRLTDTAVDARNRHQDRATTWAVWTTVSGANRPAENGDAERLPVRVCPRVAVVDLDQCASQCISLAVKHAVHRGRKVETVAELAAYFVDMARRMGADIPALADRHEAERRERVIDWNPGGDYDGQATGGDNQSAGRGDGLDDGGAGNAPIRKGLGAMLGDARPHDPADGGPVPVAGTDHDGQTAILEGGARGGMDRPVGRQSGAGNDAPTA